MIRTNSFFVDPDDKSSSLELVSETQNCLLRAVIVTDEDVLRVVHAAAAAAAGA